MWKIFATGVRSLLVLAPLVAACGSPLPGDYMMGGLSATFGSTAGARTLTESNVHVQVTVNGGTVQAQMFSRSTCLLTGAANGASMTFQSGNSDCSFGPPFDSYVISGLGGQGRVDGDVLAIDFNGDWADQLGSNTGQFTARVTGTRMAQ